MAIVRKNGLSNFAFPNINGKIIVNWVARQFMRPRHRRNREDAWWPRLSTCKSSVLGACMKQGKTTETTKGKTQDTVKECRGKDAAVSGARRRIFLAPSSCAAAHAAPHVPCGFGRELVRYGVLGCLVRWCLLFTRTDAAQSRQVSGLDITQIPYVLASARMHTHARERARAGDAFVAAACADGALVWVKGRACCCCGAYARAPARALGVCVCARVQALRHGSACPLRQPCPAPVLAPQ